MAYNFKSIADVDVVAEPSESANVLIEENGVIKKAPKTAVGGAGDSVLICYDIPNNSVTISDNAYNLLKENFIKSFTGINVTVWIKDEYRFYNYYIESLEENGYFIRIVSDGYYFDLSPDGVESYGIFD